MGITDDLKDLMPYTLRVLPFVSRDDYGLPTYGPAGEDLFEARISRRHQLVRNAQGDLVSSSSQAWIAGNPDVTIEDIVRLDIGEIVTLANILVIERPGDEEGISHTKIFFGGESDPLDTLADATETIDIVTIDGEKILFL